MQWMGMQPPPAATVNAAATARYYMSRQAIAGEARAYSMATTIDERSAEGVKTTPNDAGTQRLPSNRPIDRRWDHSRGIIFANANRSQDTLWAPGNGIVFAPAEGQRRHYAMKRFEADRPVTQTPPTQGQSKQQQTGQSLMDKPHNAPSVRPAANHEAMDKLRAEVISLKKSKETDLEEARKRQDGMDVQIAELRKQISKLQAAREKQQQYEEQFKQDAERDLKNATSEAHRRAKKANENDKAQLARQSKDNELLLRNIERLKAEMEEAAEQHSRALEAQRRVLESEHRDQMAAASARKDQRQAYNTYRQVYDELSFALNRFYDHCVSTENGLFKAAKFAAERKPYAEQIAKRQPWFACLYPQLLERLETQSKDDHKRAEKRAEDLKESRNAVIDHMQQQLGGAAHTSRALTRYHHMAEDANKLSTVDISYWIANDQVFRERRDDIDSEIEHLYRRMRLESDRSNAEALAQEVKALKEQRSSLSRISSVHAKARDVKALEALLTDTSTEKEVFAASLEADTKIKGSTRIWNSLFGEAMINEDDPDLSVQEQNSIRRDYIYKTRQAHERLTEYQDLVRKRILLQQAVGEPPSFQASDADRVIQQHLEAKIGDLRAAFARMGIPSRIKRSSSFARIKPTPVRASASTMSALAAKLAKDTGSNTSSPSSQKPVEAEDVRAEHRSLNKEETKTRLSAARSRAKANPNDSVAEEELKSLRNHLYSFELPTLEKRKVQLESAHPIDQVKLKAIKEQIAIIKGQLRSGAGGTSPTARTIKRRALRAAAAARDKDVVRKISSKSTLSGTLNMQPTRATQASHAISLSYQNDAMESGGEGAEWSDASSQLSFDGDLASLGGSSHTSGRETFDTGSSLSSFKDMRDALTDSAVSNELGVVSSNEQASPNNSGSELADCTAERDRGVASTQAPLEGPEPDMQEATTISESELSFVIPPEDLRAAATASRQSNAAYWSYKLYKNVDGKAPTVHYCRTMDQAERELQHFLQNLVVGFDIEWEPRSTRNSGPKQNVSLIQLAVEDRVCLIHTALFAGNSHEQLMPKTLRTLLEDEKVLKTGVNIQGDARRMEQYLGVTMKGQFELSHLYKVTTFARHAISKSLGGASLAAQVQNVLLLPLKKDEVRVSAWSRPLTKEQADYSASDAYAGFQLFHALEAKRKRMDPMPPRPALYQLHKPLVLGDGTVLRVQPRRVRKPTEDADERDDEPDEEFYDAIEYQDLYEISKQVKANTSSSAANASYPTLPAQDGASVNDAVASSEQQGSRTAAKNKITASKDSAKSKEVSAFATKPGVAPARPEMAKADEWIESWKASLPAEYTPKAGVRTLRAYHLWHVQGFGIKEAAAFARDPPLVPMTVASYVLEAIRTENLPFDNGRVKEALDLLPQSAHRRYYMIVDRINAHL